MAWNQPGDDNKDPWGGKGGNEGPPDLDEMARKMRDKMNSFFGSRGGKGGGSGGGMSMNFGLSRCCRRCLGIVRHLHC